MLQGGNVRILLLNTGSIGFMIEERSKESLKSEKLRGLCNAYNIDIVCLKEINKDWRLVEQRHTILECDSYLVRSPKGRCGKQDN